MITAAEYDHVNVAGALVGAMLKLNIALDAKDKAGDTALTVSSKKNYINMVQLLVDSGADTDIKTDDGFTALHLAVRKGNVDVVRILVQAKAGMYCEVL